MARDISLLSQNEVAEVAEPAAEGRGGSSAMPHKQNPVGCVLTLASANRVPGLVSTFLSSMVQEHERAVGGWQAEWATISAIVEATALAASAMAEVAEGLSVDADSMRENIQATQGRIFAEQAMTVLAAKLGKSTARKVVETAIKESVASKRDFAVVLGEIPAASRALSTGILESLQSPAAYLGSAEQFRRRLMQPKVFGKSTRDHAKRKP